MLGFTRCHYCGYRHGHGPCCMDIYQQMDQTGDPSIVGKVVLAFVLPLMIFLVLLVMVPLLLPATWSSDAKAIISGLAALFGALAWVQMTRVITRQPIDWRPHS